MNAFLNLKKSTSCTSVYMGYDVYDRKVLNTKHFSNQIPFQVSPGIYFIRYFEKDKEAHTQKIVASSYSTN
ncbi:MAG TPA: hypothetical protein VFW78_03510 [Bacteroidia bacterium]|nr:hypothetical protein [Bacteroidia bacterium]